MKAAEVKVGDVLPDPNTGGQAYKVEHVETKGLHVIAVVRFADGGNGVRQWDRRANVPLVRPNRVANGERHSFVRSEYDAKVCAECGDAKGATIHN